MMGDTGSIQAFVANTGKEVTLSKRKISILEGQHEKLVETVDTRFIRAEKTLEEANQRSLLCKQGVLALKSDLASLRLLKNTQYMTLNNDIDNLLDFKTEFNKKTDFFSKKVNDLSEICNSKVNELVTKF